MPGDLGSDSCEKTDMSTLFALGVGPMELLIFGGVMLLLFGNRLPSVMRNLGRGVIEFKKGVQGIDDEEDRARVEDKSPAK